MALLALAPADLGASRDGWAAAVGVDPALLVAWAAGAYVGVTARPAAYGLAGAVSPDRLTLGDRRGDVCGRHLSLSVESEGVTVMAPFAGGLPVYWTDTDAGPVIATDPRAILPLVAESRALVPDPAGARPIAAHGRTPFAGVRVLAPGATLRWRMDGVSITADRRWTRPPTEVDPNASVVVAGLLARAVERCLPDGGFEALGVLLSGGVDSSAVAAHVARLGVRATAISVDTPFGSEAAQAADTARRLGLDFRAIPMTTADVAGLLPGLVAALGTWDRTTLMIQAPVAFLLARLAGSVDLILTGYGADLLYAGIAAPDLGERALEAQLAADLELALTGPDTAPFQAATQGITLRHPYLDEQVIAHALGLRGRLKVRDGEVKVVLRDAVEGLLPRDIARRPKSGIHEGTNMAALFADLFRTGDQADQSRMLKAIAERVIPGG